MKIRVKALKILIFLAIFINYVLPSFFKESGSVNTFQSWTFPFQAILMSLFSCFILAISKELFPETKEILKLSKSARFIKYSSVSLLCFGLLCVIQAFFQIISVFVLKSESPSLSLTKPDSLIEFLNLFLLFYLSSFNEEVVFRFFVPSFFIDFSKGNRKLTFILEVLAVLFFALLHKYEGILAVLNAFFAGIVLRLTFLKTKSLLPGFISHFLYNFLTVLVFIALKLQ